MQSLPQTPSFLYCNIPILTSSKPFTSRIRSRGSVQNKQPELINQNEGVYPWPKDSPLKIELAKTPEIPAKVNKDRNYIEKIEVRNIGR